MAALLEGVAAHATHDHMNALPLDAATLARALFDDVPSAVALCDATDLSLIAINAAARSWVGPPRAIGGASDPSGIRDTKNDARASSRVRAGVSACDQSTVWDVLPTKLRDDHRAALTQVIQTGHAVRVLGMVRGRWTASVYRPATLDNGSAGVLCVWSPIVEGTRLDHGSCNDDTVTVRAAIDDLGPLAVLTERELEILRYIGLGLTSEQIGNELHRSVKTVQGHRNALGLKLGIENRVELARIAMRTGVTGLSPEQAVDLGRRARKAKRQTGTRTRAAATKTGRTR